MPSFVTVSGVYPFSGAPLILAHCTSMTMTTSASPLFTPNPPQLVDGDGNVVVMKKDRLVFKTTDGREFILPDDLDELHNKNKELERMFEDCFVTGKEKEESREELI